MCRDGEESKCYGYLPPDWKFDSLCFSPLLSNCVDKTAQRSEAYREEDNCLHDNAMRSTPHAGFTSKISTPYTLGWEAFYDGVGGGRWNDAG